MVEWLPISELFEFEKGSLQSSKCTQGKYTFVTAAEDWKTHNSFTHDCEALIFAMAASGSLGRTHYIRGKFISSDLCFILTPKEDKKIDLPFYYRVFNFIREDIVKKTATGTSKLAINRTSFGNYSLPYFDFDHQLLYREKIDKIASIKGSLADGFTNQQKCLSLLRQSILHEAIEGKLTVDWRKKNPVRKGDPNTDAAALLDEIKAEKQKLIAEGKLKKEKPLAPIKLEDIPFELPNGWVWCRLGEIVESMNNGIYKQAQYYNDSGIGCLRMYNIKDGEINRNNLKRMILTENEIERYKIEIGDIIFNRVNSVELLGKAAINRTIDELLVYESKNIRVRFVNKDVLPFYINIIFLSNIIHNQILMSFKKVTGQASVNQGQLSKYIFPLPPIAEQKAIVDRVGRLFGMEGELVHQVKDRQSQAEQLMQAVLREAFEGQ